MPAILFNEISSAQSVALKVDHHPFQIQGHRGCRGLQPENTIPAFIEALRLGVSVLEMDVVVTADSQLVVSHEPWMSWEICLTPDGKEIQPGEDSMLYNIYKMTYDEVRKYDCGSKVHPRFLKQEKKKTYKPLLSEVFDRVEQYSQWNKHQAVFYNIETKSTPAGDGIYNPSPEEFVHLLYTELKKKNILKRVSIQSFDVRTLQVLHKIDPTVKTVLLVDDSASVEQQLLKLGFKPTIYSPDFHLMNREIVASLHQQSIHVIPWTVNDEQDMIKLYEMGVDGIISDYPDVAIKLFKKEKVK